MKRNIIFGTDTSTIGASLGMKSKRGEEIETYVTSLVQSDRSLEEIITALNERGDLTDAEWTATIFGLGHFCARIGR